MVLQAHETTRRSFRGSVHRGLELVSQDDNRRTILVVDGHASLRHVLRRVLERSGYRVEIAENGAQGLERLRSGRVDLVVLDIDMPVMNGRAFLAARAADASLLRIPVVIYSAAPGPARVPVGVSAWIWKGSEVAELLHALSVARPAPARVAARRG